MRYVRIILAATSLLLGYSAPLLAQFYDTGNESAFIKWQHVKTDHYDVIYPVGLDSLAGEYARSLEKVYPAIGLSTGVGPYQHGRRFPVTLHPYTGYSNGMVVWTPRRMELYTNQDEDNKVPLDWMTSLTIHEQRHVAQMQAFNTGWFRPPYFIAGEMWAGAFCALYGEPMWFEGDAVVAETALSNSGRGRTADFLNYYMAAFDEGDMRTFQKWKTGEHGKYSPDIYALGYMTISGYRTMLGASDIMKNYLGTASHKPYIIWRNRYISKPISGKNVSNTFPQIAGEYQDRWKSEIEARAPFMPYQQIVETPRYYTEYDNLTVVENDLYGTCSSIGDPHTLVRIDSLGAHRVAVCGSSADFTSDEEHVFWSEIVPGLRWDLGGGSRIGVWDKVHPHRKRYITPRNSKYYCPEFNHDLFVLSVSEHYTDGSTHLEIISAEDGRILRCIHVPDGGQLNETCWDGNSTVYAVILKKEGFGIYRIKPFESNEFEMILAPQPVVVENPEFRDGKLFFTSDMNGVSELYELDVETGRMLRRSSTRYGSSDFVFLDDYLYYLRNSRDGKLVCRTRIEDLPEVPVRWGDNFKWEIADMLSSQERQMIDSAGVIMPDSAAVSAPKRYSRLGHALHIHSWMPLYANMSSINASSFDISDINATLGATVMIQNNLGTLSGWAGYSAHPDAENPDGPWRHSGHFVLNYRGLFPVIEAELHVNERDARQLIPLNIRVAGTNLGTGTGYIRQKIEKTPYVSGQLRAYVPMNFSSGGWNRGFIPSVTLSMSNDSYYSELLNFTQTPDISGNGNYGLEVTDMPEGRFISSATLTTTLRGYIMRSMSEQGVYPKWGLGFEGGFRTPLGLGNILSKNWYAYAYAYLPGFWKMHGFRLSATVQGLAADGLLNNLFLNTLPRGLSQDINLLSEFSDQYNMNSLLSVQYAWPVNGSFLNFGSGALSVKQILISPFFDYMFDRHFSSDLYSVGGTLSLTTGSLLWFSSVDLTIGVTACYNGGRFNPSSHFYIGPTFTADF